LVLDHVELNKEKIMTREEIIRFINENPACHLATAENGQPRVRGMLAYRADAAGVIFHTGTGKALAQQIRKNPQVEACFNSKDTQVRVSGVAEIIEDLALKKEIVAARPFMQPWVEAHGYGLLVVFRIAQCAAAVWSMASNFEPTKYQKI
jgi:pyridoxamine 5'-phosphate oxidase